MDMIIEPILLGFIGVGVYGAVCLALVVIGVIIALLTGHSIKEIDRWLTYGPDSMGE